jgi:hypothetical protein
VVALAVANVCQQASVTSILIRQAGEELACAWDGGEDMQKVARHWSLSSFRSREIRKASALLLANPQLPLTTRALQRASQMLHAAKNSAKVGVLYRGSGVTRQQANALMKLSGKKYTLPLSSFSQNKAIADEFSRAAIITHRQEVAVNTVVRNARGISINEVAPNIPAQWAREQEFVVSGSFRISEISRSVIDGTDTITLFLEAI